MSNLAQFFGAPASGYPFLLPTLFGSGGDGAQTLTTNADVGYLGSYGVVQSSSASLAAGQTLTVAQGGSNGAMIFGCSGTLTIAGSIVANGANGGNGIITQGGAGGATAGSGVGGAAKATNGAGNAGTAATAYGHGAGVYGDASSTINGRGAGGGAFQDNNATTSAGGAGLGLEVLNTATSNTKYLGTDLFLDPVAKLIRFNKFLTVGVAFNAGANGTTAPTAFAFTGATTHYAPRGTPLSLTCLVPGMCGPGGSVTGVVGQQAAGGGGGGGGGVIYIEANNLVLTAGYSITANGGNGGNGFSSNGTTAVGGGGTGGDGGLVIIVYKTLTGSTAAITASAGSAGTGAGTSAANGLAGSAGRVILIKV